VIHHHAESLVALGRYAEAASMLSTQLAADPDNAVLVALLARCQIGTGDYPAALATANRYVAMQPEDEWGHRLASVALDRMGNSEEALLAAQQAVRLAPLEWRTHVQLAMAAVDARGRLVEARDAAARAVTLAPNEPGAHFAVGVVAQARHEDDIARAAYERTLALNPQHAQAHNNLTVLDGGMHLGRKARGFAESLRHAPAEALVQRNVEALAASFVRRIYIAGPGALLVGLVVSRAAGGITPVTVATGSALLVGSVAYTVHLGREVPLGIRRFVLARMRRDPFLIANCALTSAMLAVALVTCFVPGGDTLGVVALRPIGLANVALVVWTVVRRSQ
jgi:Flp pilus assembly protein TadD